jgi:hypothetical protein
MSTAHHVPHWRSVYSLRLFSLGGALRAAEHPFLIVRAAEYL